MKDPKEFNSIKEIRDSIDEIDFRILKLFAERNCFVEKIVRFKKDREGVIAIERQEKMFAERRKWAKEFNLDPDLFEDIFKMLINNNIKKELEILEQRENSGIK